eukprot:6197961-Pleurochrysis_carterae.AAC.3
MQPARPARVARCYAWPRRTFNRNQRLQPAHSPERIIELSWFHRASFCTPRLDERASVALVVVDFGPFCLKPGWRVRRQSLLARFGRLGSRYRRKSATRGPSVSKAMRPRRSSEERGRGGA